MKKFILFFLILSTFFITFGLCDKYDKVEKKYLKKVRNLDVKYQNFYREVYWISTKKERKVFLKLKTNKERDAFIKDFWKCRDLNPKTPENEYKRAYEINFLYVQKYFSVKGVRPGWLTDRGRIFLLLGKPVSVSRNPVPGFKYPTEAWTYYGNPSFGLPPKFVLYFVDKGNNGLYKLYMPSKFRRRNRTRTSVPFSPTPSVDLFYLAIGNYCYTASFSPTPLGDENSSFSPSNNTSGYLVNDSQAASMLNQLDRSSTLYEEIFSLPKRLFKTDYLKKYKH